MDNKYKPQLSNRFSKPPKDDNPLTYMSKYGSIEQKDASLMDMYLDLFLNVSKDMKDNLILKGNILLNQLLPNTARATKDLDMDCIDKELYDEVVLPRLEAFANTAIKKGLATSYSMKDKDLRKNGGITLKDSEGRKVFEIDCSLTNTSSYGTMMYKFNTIEYRGYTVDRIISDKVLSTLSRSRFRRVKDFYDLYIILESKIAYNINTIFECLLEKESIERLAELLDNFPFNEDVLSNLDTVWDKFTVDSFSKEIILDKPSLAEVLTTISGLYMRLKAVYNERVIQN